MQLKNYPDKRIIAEVALPLPIDKTFYYEYPSKFTIPAKPAGSKVKVSFGNKPIVGVIVGLHQEHELDGKLPKKLKFVDKIYPVKECVPDEMLDLAKWMAGYYCCSLGEALQSVFPVKSYTRERPKHDCMDTSYSGNGKSENIELSREQKDAFDNISQALVSGKPSTFLLYGITGSGKTEIYVKLLRHVLESGGSGIFLVPEISLTPQFIKKTYDCFPGEVVLWHSRLSRKERNTAWEELASGEKKIVLGVRSAIFAPLKNIKVIIIDEEQEDTYKQETKPMYHTREVAKKRAQYHNATVILGSATPDVSSFYKAQTGEYKLVKLTKRFADAPLPKIDLIDLKAGYIGRTQALVTKDLVFAVKRALARREQIILFLNRRGFSPNCICYDCGWTARCPRCSVSLVKHEQVRHRKKVPYHLPDMAAMSAQKFREKINTGSAAGILRCHLCGYFGKIPVVCPECRNQKLTFFGLGTQKLEKEIRRLFPEARVFRMDYDSTREKDIHQKIYNDFLNEKFDILLGTQMISKGFDFPRVTLVGIIDADILMNLPDFRAAEKTFRMIVQVAGRAGRKELAGRVLIQTYYPDNFVLNKAKLHDYEEFYKEDIKSREMFEYPPFMELISVTVIGKNEEDVIKGIESISRSADEFIRNKKLKDKYSGPSPAIRPFVNNMFRYQLLIKTSAGNKILWSEFLKATRLKASLRMSVDVDPQSLCSIADQVSFKSQAHH